MTNDRGKKRSEDDNSSHAQRPPSRAKRMRVSQACNECRKKKERCDGAQPQCGPCTSLNRSCCFDAQPRRRGLPTGYVRAVEIFLGLMFHSIDGIEHRATAIMRGERDLPPWHMDPSLPMTVNSLADAWRRSGTMKELEQLLAGVESGEESELSTRDLYEKLEGAFMDRLIINDNSSARVGLLSPPQTNTPSILEQIAPDIAAENQGTLLAVSNNTPHVPFFEESQETMDLLHNWSHLLDRYFTDTHTWFPIASKHDVLRQAFCLANSGTEAEGQERMMSNGGRAALNATLAYASYRDALSNQDRAGQVESSFTSAEGQRCGSPSVHLTRRLQNEAMSILNDDSKQIEYDDGHVQALLVLTILQIDQGSLQQAWITIGKAVHIAVILKIIPSSHRDTISAVSDKQRRLFLGIYVLETLLAYNLEQRPYLKGVDLAKIGSLPVDGIEEWEAWRPLDRHESTTGRARTPGRSLSVFNTFLNLITLLNDHAHGTYSLDQSLQGFQSWKTALSSAYQNALISIEASSFETPPQMQNLMLASLSIGVVLQVKSCRVQENRQSPASLTAIPASARDALEAIMRHRRRSMPSQSCPLMPIYISMIQSQVDIYGQPHILSDLQQPPEPTNRSTRPTNHGRSLDYLELQTSPSYPSPIQASIANASFDDFQALEPFEARSLSYHESENSLFDSLAFLDTADCSHQSGRFLENFGISSEVTPFDIETLFAR